MTNETRAKLIIALGTLGAAVSWRDFGAGVALAFAIVAFAAAVKAARG